MYRQHSPEARSFRKRSRFDKHFARFKPKISDSYAIILDFLPNGYPFDSRPLHKKTPIAQAITTENFLLVELIPKRDVFLQPQEKVSIKQLENDKISRIGNVLTIDKLTQTARAELEHAIKNIVRDKQKEFVEFFNKAGPLTTRMHSLELLPGIGKRYMWDIIRQREEKLFESFEDLKQRVKLPLEIETIIAQRIVKELEGNEKHYLFIRPKTSKR